MAYVRLHDRQLSSMAGARWPRQRADTVGHVNPLVAVVSANRCDEMCRHAATRCWLAVCVHNTRATPPRLRACATITRTCPRPSARLGCIQVGEADDETSRQRGVWDVPEHQRRPVVAQKGRSGGHSGEDHGTGSWTSRGCSWTSLTDYEITASSKKSSTTVNSSTGTAPFKQLARRTHKKEKKKIHKRKHLSAIDKALSVL